MPGLCPDDLRIIPQCSMPFEKGSRMGLRKLPVTVRDDGDDVFDTATGTENIDTTVTHRHAGGISR